MTLIKTSCVLLLLLLLGAAGFAVLVIDPEPLVTESSELTPNELRRARQFIRGVFASNRNASQPAQLRVSDAETEILLTQVLEQLRGGDASVRYAPGQVHLQLTAVLPPSPLGSYANVDLILQQREDRQLELQQFRLGSLELPGWLANKLLQFGHRQLHLRLPEYTMLMSSIADFEFRQNALELSYTLTPETLGQLSSRGSELLLPAATSARLQAHAAYLSELEEQLEALRDSRNNVSLADVLGPMFRFALQRDGDPAEENRALLLVLAMHQMDMQPARLLRGAPAPQTQRRRLHFTLYDRRDFAQHFLGSAVLATNLDPALADAIGVLKELDDAVEGSGFSFTDLAADMAGVRFAEVAVLDKRRARAVQEQMAGNNDEALFMFDLRGLPEFLGEEEFRRVYGEADSEAYYTLMQSIEDAIAATPLYRQR
jgi:hypothetical protein